MEEITLCSPEHQEVFRRVWNRVMAGHPEQNCPLEITGDLPCDCLEQLAKHQNQGQGQNQAPQQTAPADARGSDLSMDNMELPPSDETTARLRQQVLEALEGWQLYRHLARRTRSAASRTLAALAADQHKQARRLSAAYFLLTGLRYWPVEMLTTPPIPSFWGTLRQRHQAEQQSELSYRMSADEVSDPSLLELYQQLAEGCRGHCRQLRTLMEQSCP